jgi:hypothetical protein
MTFLLSLVLAATIHTNYVCQGTGENGDYKTPLAIEQKGDNYFLTWDSSRGMGFRYNDQLVIAFIVGPAVGVMLYEISDDKLVGIWSGGNGQTYTEFCTVAPAKVTHQL